ncbi:MAG TPA: pentapeptide repeat-containing protein [Chloroflexia bacterium]|nr:pentapeptide repeat-containing protein [Chloroflexia bacterium]
MISLLYGVFTYTVLEAGPRREAELKTEIAAAWQTLNSGLGQGGNAGRIDALETLNRYNISLAGVTVTDAFLFRLNLPGADLERANFKGADLRSVVFEGAYLMEANFEGAILLAANFKDARLSGANFRGAMMEYSNLENAKIDRADLRGAWVGASNFQGTVLFQTCVEGVSFADARNLTSEQVSETVGISTPCRPVPSP